MLNKIGSHLINTKYGKYELFGFQYSNNNNVIALKSKSSDWNKNYLLRIQFGCLHSTAFFSTDCDCFQQLEYSFKLCSRHPPSVIIYFPDHDGYGLGIMDKIKMMEVEETKGISSIKALQGIGCTFDNSNSLEIVPELLNKIGVGNSCNLITNSPQKIQKLITLGIKVVHVHPILIDESNLSQVGISEINDKRDYLSHYPNKPKL